MESETAKTSSWLDRPLASFLPRFSVETLLVIIILIVAVFSRYDLLGERVMSHDETNHVVPSYDFFMGKGYRHDPITHGPLQFHLLAFSFFLFGDSDTSARIPSATFSVVTVLLVMVLFRRYMGKAGAIIAGLLFLISPYMLFYGRYTRNESFVALWGILTIYAVLSYLEKGQKRYLFLLTAVTVLHFDTKETVYIYVAQLLVFLLFVFLYDISRTKGTSPEARVRFITLTLIALALVIVALGAATYGASTEPKATEAAPNQPASPVPSVGPLGNMQPWVRLTVFGSLGLGILFGLGALYYLFTAFGWKGIRGQRSFDMLLLIATLILPLLAAAPVKLIGWDPLDYTATGMLHTGIIVGFLAIIAIAIGVWWNARLWLANAALFYAIFTVFYTTFFTNAQGFWTGLVGSLGYWLAQQGVQRGSQPLYYYALIQIPIYEYLGALGTLLAIYFGIRYHRFSTVPGFDPARQPVDLGLETGEAEHFVEELPIEDEEPAIPPTGEEPAPEIEVETAPAYKRIPTLALLVYWSVTALVAYSVAGEKMPWLTVHIALPLLLAAGWGLGFLVDRVHWKTIASLRGVIAVLLLPVFFTSAAAVMGSLLGAQPPFQGSSLEQLTSTNTFVFGLIAAVASVVGIFWLLKDWSGINIVRLAAVVFFGLLAVLTARAAYRANFINYDTALEYLVYAHAARGPKDILAQVEEISRRTTGGKEIVVAYDNDALYPYWWYFRDYPNKRWYTTPSRDLANDPVIIASETNYQKVDSIVRDNYYYTEYMRLWWPNQDYFNLTWQRIVFALTNRDERAAIFDIWLNRDYTAYAKVNNNTSLTLTTWQPSSRFRLYVRKDIAAQIWEYGAAPAAAPSQATDPYVQKMTQIAPDAAIASGGSEPGQLQHPRGLSVAPDGTIYVADSGNNRIEHFSPDGKLLQAWGTFADVSKGQAPGGTFYEPWDVAVGKDGSVFVTDTWNHRVQKFSADGKFLQMWGYFGQAEKPEAFWGPRGLAVDGQGRVYVVDTGNKRVVIFNPDGTFVAQFGSAGLDPGQFDEPVGIAVDSQGLVYITDTWNQRIQIFQPDASGTSFTPLRNWEVAAWYGQSLDNKPFIAVDNAGHVWVTDPEGYRVLEFDNQGSFVRGWGDYSTETSGFGLAAGVALDPQGGVWVSDAANNRLLHFVMPNP